MSLWKDITANPKTGHVVAKDYFKAVAFHLGCGIVAFGAWADWRAGRPVDLTGGLGLLTYALGVGLAKLYEGQENRRTTDASGNPLAQPGTADPPAGPKLMPQESDQP